MDNSHPKKSSRPGQDRTQPRRGRGPKVPIVVEEPGYLELTDHDRREAVAALTDLLIAWWHRHADETGLPQLGGATGEDNENATASESE